MPEGPSIVILKEAVRALKLEGQRVLAVEGNTTVDFSVIPGLEVVGFESWGKHFLVCFEAYTIRIHFLLFGTYRINERKDSPARLSLLFETAELNFYACSVRLLEGHVSGLYDWEADVLSDKWNADKALAKLQSLPRMLICDALLNQDIFAGSGNIIKNEVLFRTRVHPLSKTGSIPPDLLQLLVATVRIYSFEFLKWKKEFTLRQHWQAHTRTVCPRCHIPLQKDYLGLTRRRSFYCSNCQQLYD